MTPNHQPLHPAGTRRSADGENVPAVRGEVGSLYPAGLARVVPLPAYPFARERYWIAERPVEGPLADSQHAAYGWEIEEARPQPSIDEVLDNLLSGTLGVEAAAEHIRLSVLDGASPTTDGGR